MDWSMIGDLIMLSPCIRAIRNKYPDAEIALLGQPVSIATYKNHPGIQQLIPYDRSHGDYNLAAFMSAVNELREKRFDLAFIFHNSFGSALMATLGRVRTRIGYRSEFRDFMLTKKFNQPDHRQHLIETKADLLRMFGFSMEDLDEEVFIDKDAAKVWLKEKLGPNFGRSRPIIGISLGATMPYKRWDAKGLNNFINMFPVNSCDFVFLGSPADRPLFEGVYSYNNTVVDLVGETTIEELTWVLDRVDLYVGPDSGPMHLAVGRKTPLVALFGPTDPTICGPYNYDKAIVVRSQKICRSCDTRHGRHVRQCLHTLNADEAYVACIQLLTKYCPRFKPDSA